MSMVDEQSAVVATTTNGYLSVDAILENGPADLEEVDVEGVFGGKVRIRALTAAQVALVQQAGIKVNAAGNRVINVSIDAIERKQFQFGVVDPPLNAEQVRTLHMTSGRSFKKVVREIDRISAMDKEALRDAQNEFPEPDER